MESHRARALLALSRQKQVEIFTLYLQRFAYASLKGHLSNMISTSKELRNLRALFAFSQAEVAHLQIASYETALHLLQRQRKIQDD